MKVLNNIKSEDIISIDIETVRISETYELLDPSYQSAWEYKNKQDGEIPDYEELSESWEKNSSLYAEFSKVCAVSLTFLHDSKLYCKEFYGENEVELLEYLAITLNNISVKSKNYRLAGHASKFFDYPFLAKRFVINGLDIPDILDVTNAKPWEQMNLCTNELWKMGGTGAGSSLQALCVALNIPISKVDLVGDEVGKSFYNKEYERIGRYCSYDTVATFNVIRKLKKESIFDFDSVTYITSYPSARKETANQLPLLERLYNENYLSDKIKSELETILKKKKMTVKDRKNVKTILEGIYIVSEFMKSDDAQTVERKKNEIEEFLKTI